MKPEPKPSSTPRLIQALLAAALLSLAIIPAWAARNLSFDGLVAGESFSSPKLMLPAIHL